MDIEPLVVSEMVGEIVDRPGALPLLQYTLTELFEAASRTHDHDRRLPRRRWRVADAGPPGRLARSPASARRPPRRPGTCCCGSSASTTDGSGTETRRRALVAEVEELGDRGRVQRVLDTFGRHRLLSFDRDPVTRGPTVEISHEALLTEWTTLRGWIDDARDDLRAHRHLVGEMNAWTAAERSPDYLLRGERLDAIAAWASSTTMGLRPAEHEFLDASLAARAEHQRVRDEERAPTTDAEHRARRRTRQLVVAALVLAMVAGLASFAWVQREDARQAEEYLATNLAGQRLADLSVKTLPTDPELALLLAKQAVSATADSGYALPEAIDAMHWALQDLGVQYAVTPDTPTAARFGPSGVRGVWVLPVDELMSMADAATTRTLTVEECRRYVDPSGCAAPVSGTVRVPRRHGRLRRCRDARPGRGRHRHPRQPRPGGRVPAQPRCHRREVRAPHPVAADPVRGRRRRPSPSGEKPTSTRSPASRSSRWRRPAPCSTCERSSTRRNCSTTTARTSSRCRGSAATARGPATPDPSTPCPSAPI